MSASVSESVSVSVGVGVGVGQLKLLFRSGKILVVVIVFSGYPTNLTSHFALFRSTIDFTSQLLEIYTQNPFLTSVMCHVGR